MRFDALNTDSGLLAELGQRLARQRLNLRMTQADLAAEAGISKRTLERIEAGRSVQLTNLVRLLRVLRLVEHLEALVPDSGPRPMDLLRTKGRQRRRASSTHRGGDSAGEWRWGDEEPVRRPAGGPDGGGADE